MTKLSWFAWIWLQVVMPLALGVVAIGVFGIPFALIWPPITKAQAWFVLALGFCNFLLLLWLQKRKIQRDGMLPPFSPD